MQEVQVRQLPSHQACFETVANLLQCMSEAGRSRGSPRTGRGPAPLGDGRSACCPPAAFTKGECLQGLALRPAELRSLAISVRPFCCPSVGLTAVRRQVQDEESLQGLQSAALQLQHRLVAVASEPSQHASLALVLAAKCISVQLHQARAYSLRPWIQPRPGARWRSKILSCPLMLRQVTCLLAAPVRRVLVFTPGCYRGVFSDSCVHTPTDEVCQHAG